MGENPRPVGGFEMGSASPHIQLAEELVSLDHGENLAKAAIQAIQQLLEERNFKYGATDS